MGKSCDELVLPVDQQRCSHVPYTGQHFAALTEIDPPVPLSRCRVLRHSVAVFLASCPWACETQMQTALRLQHTVAEPGEGLCWDIVLRVQLERFSVRRRRRCA
jgi:hypothetical protein